MKNKLVRTILILMVQEEEVILVMERGTFANVRLRNKITPEKEGGYTKLFPENEIMTIYKLLKNIKKEKFL